MREKGWNTIQAFTVVVVVLILFSWIKSYRATPFDLSASTCNQQEIKQKFFLLAKFSLFLFLVTREIPT